MRLIVLLSSFFILGRKPSIFFSYRRIYSTGNSRTIITETKNIKTFLNDATKKGLNDNMVFRSKKFLKPSEDTDAIYLNEKKLERLINFDFSDTPSHERIRDLFIVGCYAGLRFGDFSNLKSHNVSEVRGEFRAYSKSRFYFDIGSIVMCIGSVFSTKKLRT